MKNQDINIFKVDGSNLYFIDDMVYVCSDNYSHFYKIEDAFSYYKKLQEVLKKNVVFDFLDYELTIDQDTTLENIKDQLNFQKLVMQKEIDEFKKIKKDFYSKYISSKNDSKTKLLYKIDFPKIKK